MVSSSDASWIFLRVCCSFLSKYASELFIIQEVDTRFIGLKEGEYQKANECVNYVIAGRTVKEWYQDNTKTVLEQQKQYYKLNADKVCERTKKYYDANVDKMKEQRRQRYLRDKELKKEKIETV